MTSLCPQPEPPWGCVKASCPAVAAFWQALWPRLKRRLRVLLLAGRINRGTHVGSELAQLPAHLEGIAGMAPVGQQDRPGASTAKAGQARALEP